MALVAAFQDRIALIDRVIEQALEKTLTCRGKG